MILGLYGFMRLTKATSRPTSFRGGRLRALIEEHKDKIFPEELFGDLALVAALLPLTSYLLLASSCLLLLASSFVPPTSCSPFLLPLCHWAQRLEEEIRKATADEKGSAFDDESLAGLLLARRAFYQVGESLSSDHRLLTPSHAFHLLVSGAGARALV